MCYTELYSVSPCNFYIVNLCTFQRFHLTPQYLVLMKSDLHETFRITLYWSAKMIYDVIDNPILHSVSLKTEGGGNRTKKIYTKQKPPYN